MKKNPITLKSLQERSDMTVFICVMNELEKLGWLFKDRFSYDTKQAVNQFLTSGKLLTKKFDKMMDGSEDLHNVSEAFSVLIEIARKQDETKFLELMGLIKAWDAGEVTVINE